MKARKFVWLVSVAVLAGLVSLTAQHLSAHEAKSEMRADGGAPVPPPPPRPVVSGINA
jgi:hypothetical protein